MSNVISKKKIIAIAFGIFISTLALVFLFVNESQLEIEGKDLQSFILFEENANKELGEAEYRAMINNYEDDFIITNVDRTFRFITPNLEKAHGYTLEEMKSGNVNVLTFINPKDLPAFSNILMEFHKNIGIMRNIGPIRIKTKSDEYIQYLITLIPFTNKEGERTGAAVILKNISKAVGDIAT